MISLDISKDELQRALADVVNARIQVTEAHDLADTDRAVARLHQKERYLVNLVKIAFDIYREG